MIAVGNFVRLYCSRSLRYSVILNLPSFCHLLFENKEIIKQHSPLPPINSLLASGDFCRLLMIFANSLDPDQDRQNVGPDLGPNILTL